MMVDSRMVAIVLITQECARKCYGGGSEKKLIHGLTFWISSSDVALTYGVVGRTGG